MLAAAVAALAPAPRLAVLQPYFFPYLGTFQLARAVDHFVFFDDVAFIKKGHIHRNAVLLNGQAHAFTVPVRHASQNRTIAEHEYTGEWAGLLNLLRTAYRQAPHFDAAYALVEGVALHPDDNVARKNALAMQRVFAHLGLPQTWSFSSTVPQAGLKGQDRVLELCRHWRAGSYVNPASGRALYAPQAFAGHGLALRFIRSLPTSYAQAAAPFVPNLSMIDLLMHCTPAEIVSLMGGFELDP
jgi:hypothetical protein